MTKLDDILEATQSTTIDPADLLAEIEAEEVPEDGNGLKPGASVGHSDYSDFRALYVGPGRRPHLALVQVVSGWTTDEPPAWPVSIPLAKLEVLT